MEVDKSCEYRSSPLPPWDKDVLRGTLSSGRTWWSSKQSCGVSMRSSRWCTVVLTENRTLVASASSAEDWTLRCFCGVFLEKKRFTCAGVRDDSPKGYTFEDSRTLTRRIPGRFRGLLLANDRRPSLTQTLKREQPTRSSCRGTVSAQDDWRRCRVLSIAFTWGVPGASDSRDPSTDQTPSGVRPWLLFARGRNEVSSAASSLRP